MDGLDALDTHPRLIPILDALDTTALRACESHTCVLNLHRYRDRQPAGAAASGLLALLGDAVPPRPSIFLIARRMLEHSLSRPCTRLIMSSMSTRSVWLSCTVVVCHASLGPAA